MAYDMLEHCPDYLRDFEQIQELAYAQKMTYTRAKLQANNVFSKAKFFFQSDEWKDMVNIHRGNYWVERACLVLRRYEYISTEEYNKLVECWIDGDFVLTIDYENLSVVIKTTERIYNVNEYADAIRDVFPCNMTFEIEYVLEL